MQGDTGGLKKIKGVTGNYCGLRELRRGYKGFQGVTGGLQGVTMGYKRLQGLHGARVVLEGYKGLQGS